MSDFPARALFLPHIRKTGGTSYKHFLFNRFAVQDSFLRAHFSSQRETDPDDFRFVSGIVDFGYLSRFSNRPLVLSCLRDPLERTLSEYFYQRSDPLWEHLLELKATPGEEARAERRLGVAEIFRNHTPLEMMRDHPGIAREFLGNMQTRALAGATEGTEANDEDEAALAAIAIENLRNSEVIVLTERPQESLKVLCHTMGWEPDSFAALLNATSGRGRAGDFDQETLVALQAGIRHDLALYAEAVSLFEKRLSVLDRPSLNLMPIPPGRADGFTFDQAIPGRGWHRREEGPEGWFAWSTNEATLTLSTEAGEDLALSLRLVTALHLPALDDLEVWVNDRRVELIERPQPLPADWVALIPREVVRLSTGSLRLVLRTQAARPCDLNPLLRDGRHLGIGVSRVSCRPLEATELIESARIAAISSPAPVVLKKGGWMAPFAKRLSHARLWFGRSASELTASASPTGPVARETALDTVVHAHR